MTPVHITAHAVSRFQERVRNLPEAEVITALSGDLFTRAADFAGKAEVRVTLPDGQKVVIHDRSIVTVLPSQHYRPRRKREIEE